MKFRSAVLDLPSNIRAELESMIEKDRSGLAIYSSLKEKYGNTTTIPTVPTLLRYIRYYKERKGTIQKQVIEEKLAFTFEDGIREVENVLVQISQGKEPSFNKVKLLEGLAAKCLERIHFLETIDGGQKQRKRDSRIETAIARYISEAKNIMESLTKLSGDVQKDEQVLIQLIRNESKEMLSAVKDVILAICPEKYNLFREKLKLKLSEKGAVLEAQPIEVPQLQEPKRYPTFTMEPGNPDESSEQFEENVVTNVSI